VRLLLDTHVLLWWLAEPERLPDEVVEAIRDTDNQVFLSTASVWEMAIKSSLGKLDLGTSLPALVSDVTAKQKFEELPIAHPHAVLVAEFPQHHRDPFDRILVAQAIVEGLTLVTADQAVMQYDADLWRV